MWFVLLVAVVIAIPVAALIWRRRATTGEPGHDAQSHRDIGSGGVPRHSGTTQVGDGLDLNL